MIQTLRQLHDLLEDLPNGTVIIKGCDIQHSCNGTLHFKGLHKFANDDGWAIAVTGCTLRRGKNLSDDAIALYFHTEEDDVESTVARIGTVGFDVPIIPNTLRAEG